MGLTGTTVLTSMRGYSMSKSDIKLGIGIFIVAIIVNIIVESDFYSGLMVALS